MNKDALLATVIGFGVGLIIAALVFLGPTVFKNMPQIRMPNLASLWSNFTAQKNNAAPTPTPKPNEVLSIQSPLPESIEQKNESLISGASPPNAIVVIEGESTENIIIANAEGSYAGKISLGEGKNEITVTSYAGANVQVQSVTVYYTPEDF